MKLEVNSTMPFKEYNIKLKRNSSNAKVYFERYTEKLAKKSTKDSLRLNVLFDKKDRDRSDIQEIYSIINKYKIYETDSISLDLKHPIIKYADSITNSEKKFKKEKVEKEGRIVIDGTNLILNVKCFSDYKFRYYFNSPDEKTFPLIYIFWQELKNYYNNNSKKQILDKDYFDK